MNTFPLPFLSYYPFSPQSLPLSYFINPSFLSYLTLSYLNLSYLTSLCIILSHPITPHLILSSLIVSHRLLYCIILHYIVFYYRALDRTPGSSFRPPLGPSNAIISPNRRGASPRRYVHYLPSLLPSLLSSFCPFLFSLFCHSFLLPSFCPISHIIFPMFLVLIKISEYNTTLWQVRPYGLSKKKRNYCSRKVGPGQYESERSSGR